MSTIGGVCQARDMIDEWLRGQRPAVIFDFNGTLSDDEPILFEIFSDLFHAHLHWAPRPTSTGSPSRTRSPSALWRW